MMIVVPSASLPSGEGAPARVLLDADAAEIDARPRAHPGVAGDPERC